MPPNPPAFPRFPSAPSDPSPRAAPPQAESAEPLFVEAEPAAAEPEAAPRRICGARAKGTGKPCQLPPLAGRTRCRMHGGASPRGVASARYIHGRYSRALKDVPKVLREAYRDGMQDWRLARCKDELALLDGRIAQLVATLSLLDPEEEDAVWGRLLALIAQRTRTASVVTTWEYAKERCVTAEEAVAFTDCLIQGLRETIPDEKLLQAAQQRILDLLAGHGFST